jgi:hypothetical protein
VKTLDMACFPRRSCISFEANSISLKIVSRARNGVDI